VLRLQFVVDSRRLQRLVEKAKRELSAAKARRIVRPALRVLRDEGRRLTRSQAGASSRLRRAAARTIAYSTRARRRNVVQAKVGYGVGRRRGRSHSGPGVGISKQNVHWAVLGTDERYTTNIAYRGYMKTYFLGIMERALRSAASRALRAAQEEFRKIVREVRTKTR